MIDELAKIVACGALSFGLHAAIARGLDALPPVEPPPRPPPVVTVRIDQLPPQVVKEDPPPEPEKKLPPPPPTKQIVHEAPKPTPATVHDVVRTDAPPPDHPPVTADTSTAPVFGVTMESTSQAGGGPAIPVGNTTRQPTAPAQHPGEVKPLAEPVAVYQVTKMPLPQGRCAGTYTDEAKQAGIEGVVVLDIVVGEDGRTRDVNVVQALPHGLTEAAIAAVRACRFSPGERDGVAVPVRVREFKIRFVLDAN